MTETCISKIKEEARLYADAWEQKRGRKLMLDVEDLAEEKKSRKAFYFRKHLLNSIFEWTPGNTQAIKNLNAGLLALYREAYNEVMSLKRDFEEKIAAGFSVYERYCIKAELSFMYLDNIPEDKQDDWLELCEITESWGPSIIIEWDWKDMTVEGRLGLEDFTGNQYPFDVPELDGTVVNKIMDDIFGKSETFSLVDALKMKPEDFQYHIEVDFDWK